LARPRGFLRLLAGAEGCFQVAHRGRVVYIRVANVADPGGKASDSQQLAFDDCGVRNPFPLDATNQAARAGFGVGWQ